MNNSLYRSLCFVESKIVFLEELFVVAVNYLMIGVIAWQVACRYIFTIPTPWAEEMARYIFVWMSFVACAIATNKNKHIEIDLISTIIEKRAVNIQRALGNLNKITYIVSIIFLMIMTNIYFQYLMQIFMRGQRSPALKVLLAVPMSAIFAGALLMIFHYICLLIIPERFRSEYKTEGEE